MKIHKLIIDSQLPRLNEEIEAAKQSYFKYGKHKKKNTNLVHWLCKEQLMNVKIKGSVSVIIKWYMGNVLMDPDNTYFGNKYVFDGLVSAKVIEEDRYKFTSGGVLALPFIDKVNPRAEVYIIEQATLFHEFAAKVLGDGN